MTNTTRMDNGRPGGVDVSVRELTFRYGSVGPPLFETLDHNFPAGVVSAVTGRSGVGKSTLLYLAGLMLTPSSGSVLFNNRDVSTQSDRIRSRCRAKDIGFLFQDAALDKSRTVIDNVLEAARYAGMPPGWAHDRALAMLDRLGVELRAHHRPGEVSGGQAQRVALCRALVKAPSIILADEPTGNLDREAADVVIATLQEAASGGTTVVISTHDERIVAVADRVLELSP